VCACRFDHYWSSRSLSVCSERICAARQRSQSVLQTWFFI